MSASNIYVLVFCFEVGSNCVSQVGNGSSNLSFLSVGSHQAGATVFHFGAFSFFLWGSSVYVNIGVALTVVNVVK